MKRSKITTINIPAFGITEEKVFFVEKNKQEEWSAGREICWRVHLLSEIVKFLDVVSWCMVKAAVASYYREQEQMLKDEERYFTKQVMIKGGEWVSVLCDPWRTPGYDSRVLYSPYFLKYDSRPQWLVDGGNRWVMHRRDGPARIHCSGIRTKEWAGPVLAGYAREVEPYREVHGHQYTFGNQADETIYCRLLVEFESDEEEIAKLRACNLKDDLLWIMLFSDADGGYSPNYANVLVNDEAEAHQLQPQRLVFDDE